MSLNSLLMILLKRVLKRMVETYEGNSYEEKDYIFTNATKKVIELFYFLLTFYAQIVESVP